MPPLRSHILIARALSRIRDRGFVYGYSIYFSVIEGIPREDRVFVREMVVNSTLHEMFIGRLRPREQVFTDAARERSAVRQREQIQVWSDLWVQLYRAPIDNSPPGIRVRNECRPADA